MKPRLDVEPFLSFITKAIFQWLPNLNGFASNLSKREKARLLALELEAVKVQHEAEKKEAAVHTKEEQMSGMSSIDAIAHKRLSCQPMCVELKSYAEQSFGERDNEAQRLRDQLEKENEKARLLAL